ncbi:MAG: dihydrodipicolinate synthase family protein [Halobacteriaceae archaeon]
MHDDVRAGLRSVAAGLLTPFDEELAVDHDALAGNAETVYDRGIRTFLACANISEYHSLSREERTAVVETSVGALPGDATVLAGAGGSLPDATELVEGAAAAGADAVMVMPPDHTYIHEQGLLEYYRELGEASDLPLVPYVRGFDPSVEFLAAMTRLDSVVGVKYAIEDVPKFAEAVAAGAEDVVWVDGMAEPHAPALWAEGAEGFTAGVSNFEPRIGLALFDALDAGDWARAREIRNVCLPYQNFRGETGEDNTLPAAVSVPAVKEGMALSGLDAGEGRVRPPIVELSDAERERARALYADIDAFET